MIEHGCVTPDGTDLDQAVQVAETVFDLSGEFLARAERDYAKQNLGLMNNTIEKLYQDFRIEDELLETARTNLAATRVALIRTLASEGWASPYSLTIITDDDWGCAHLGEILLGKDGEEAADLEWAMTDNDEDPRAAGLTETQIDVAKQLATLVVGFKTPDLKDYCVEPDWSDSESTGWSLPLTTTDEEEPE